MIKGILDVCSRERYIAWLASSISMRTNYIPSGSLFISVSESLPGCLLSQDDKKLEDDSVNKRRRKGNHYLTEVSSKRYKMFHWTGQSYF